ncbi:MAG: hypothetical protein HY825_00505 [Acidobacteria bacterium]|nr:hypothetical protein [Acidobacteriota bacterium]
MTLLEATGPIGLLLSLWALYWNRRKGIAAEKSAKAAESSAEAAQRSAATAERGANAAEEALRLARQRAELDREQAAEALVSGVVEELVAAWSIRPDIEATRRILDRLPSEEAQVKAVERAFPRKRIGGRDLGEFLVALGFPRRQGKAGTG